MRTITVRLKYAYDFRTLKYPHDFSTFLERDRLPYVFIGRLISIRFKNVYDFPSFFSTRTIFVRFEYAYDVRSIFVRVRFSYDLRTRTISVRF